MKKALLISCFAGWYEKRLEPIKDFLDKEYDVEIVVSDYNHMAKNEVRQRFKECKYIHVPKYNKNMSVARIWSHICFGKAAKKEIDRINPDLIYLIVPPNTTANYCLKYKKKNPQIKYYLDVIDMWPESLPLKSLKNSSVVKLWSNLRDGSVKIADHIFTECDLYRDRLKSVINDPERASTLYLFKAVSQDEISRVKSILERKKGGSPKCPMISLAYLGSINNIIDMDTIRSIVIGLKNNGYAVKIKIIGDGEKKDAFLEALKSADVEVKFYGEVYSQMKKIDLLAQCDYALNIMKSTVTVGLTIKSIDYFSMGLPIINNIKGDTWELVEKEKIGINYDGDIQKLLISIQIGTGRNGEPLQCYEKYFTRAAFEYQMKTIMKIL